VNWDLPFGRDRAFGKDLKGWADALVGGWSLSGIINLEKGSYFTPTLSNNASLNSTITLRPNRIGSGKVSNPSRSLWFNPADFTVPAPFTYGNSGRAILEGPNFASADLSLAKSFTMTEKSKLELRCDAFNALNHTNLANPNAQVDSVTAGRITNIVDFKRRIQIGAQITF
jgi:hypothetical protein